MSTQYIFSRTPTHGRGEEPRVSINFFPAIPAPNTLQTLAAELIPSSYSQFRFPAGNTLRPYTAVQRIVDRPLFRIPLDLILFAGVSNPRTVNLFTGTETLEFEEAVDTLWANNSLPSAACIEGDLDFTSDSNPPLPC